MLSRVVYQAIISERKKHLRANRPLEQILWKIASGDDWYKSIFLSMIHPLTVWSILTRGFLVTLRNFLTEQVFGLYWRGFGRFTTGISKERLEAKRFEYQQVMAAHGMACPVRLEFERMYSIKIKARRMAVKEEIGKFGELNRKYFTPRFIRVHRTHGAPNQPGCVIEYVVVMPWLSFSLVLEHNIEDHYFMYRVRDGFARNGVLIFEIEEDSKGVCLLSIYVAFDFFRGKSRLNNPLWLALKYLFPAYVHDVVWNHSLCQLKDDVETSLVSA
jgi:hypothetical protein